MLRKRSNPWAESRSNSPTCQKLVRSNTGLATAAALRTLFITRANERRRNQPIVIAHEAGQRRFAG
ncbi:MAG: hypothetical protein QOC54_1026, partial [Baekduia sp.]|nr:hypothetical protein [Baekduia sp.]